MTFQNLWQIFIYVFRCFDPNKKPIYMDYIDIESHDFEYSKLTQNNDRPYDFVIVR